MELGLAAGRAAVTKPNGRLALWMLVALTPAIFAAFTWNPAQAFTARGEAVLFSSLPVVTIELIVIVFAVALGLRPLHMLAGAPRWARFVLALLALVIAASAATASAHVVSAVMASGFWLVHILFGLSIAHLIPLDRPWVERHLWPLMVAGSLAFAALLGAFVAAIPDPAEFDWVRLGLASSHVRHLGYYSAFGGAAALGLAAVQKGWRGYASYLAAASILIGISFWSGTRGSVMGVAGGYMLCLALLPALRTRRALVTPIIAFAAAASLSLLHVPPSNFYGTERIVGSTAASDDVEELSTGRTNFWAGAMRATAERPFIGHGEAQFRRIVPESDGKFSHPHSAIFQIPFQWGLIGAACFLLLAGLLGWRCLIAARAAGESAVPATGVIASLGVMSGYEGVFYYPYPIMMLTLAIVYLVSLQSRTELPGG